MVDQIADLDLEKVEALLKESKIQRLDPNDPRKQERKKNSRSRSRSRKHKNDSKSHSRSRKKTHKKKKAKDHEKSRSRDKSPGKPAPKDPKAEEFRILEEKLKEAQRLAEESKRDDLTCLLLNLPLQAKEFDIYQFLNKENIGKVRDIRIIRDARNGRSKGIAYVEFYDQDSVLKAIALTGKNFMGNAIKFQHSQAEKNRLAAANKQIKYPKNAIDNTKTAPGAMRIYVGGLTDHLSDLKDQDLKELFSPFGEIEFVDLHRDISTGKSKGFAFIQYKNANDAKEAINKMNGFLLRNKPLKVSTVQQNMAGIANNSYNMYVNTESLDLDEESGNNFLHSAQSRAMLMQKLTRENPAGLYMPATNLLLATPNPTPMTMPMPMQMQMQMEPVMKTPMMQLNKEEISLQPTTCILLSNMFSKEDTMKNNSTFLADLKDEVEDECKNYGDVRKIILDPESEGNIWVKFDHVQSAINTQKSLHDRYFSGKKVMVNFVQESLFKKKFGS